MRLMPIVHVLLRVSCYSMYVWLVSWPPSALGFSLPLVHEARRA